MAKHKKEDIERIIIKLPQSVAEYFRSAFPHGKRSNFVLECILHHKHEQDIEKIEEQLRGIGKKRN